MVMVEICHHILSQLTGQIAYPDAQSIEQVSKCSVENYKFFFQAKFIGMKHVYAVVIFTLFLGGLKANVDPSLGYIVTKNGIHLTGKIGKLDHTNSKCSIVFINDFGNIYELYPELIKGFVYKADTILIIFESKIERDEKRWVFMQAICKGKGLNLYKSVSEKTPEVTSVDGNFNRNYKVQNYYLESSGKLPFRIKKWGFKKQMGDLIRKRAPDLADKIGEKGYRYRDLEKIINEYNVIVNKSRRLI